MSDLIDAEELEGFLKKVPEWELDGTKKIVRTLEFDDFMEGIEFVNDLAEIAEEAGHHPDIDIRENRVVVMLTTHDAGGLTEDDFTLAKRIDNLVD
jgi:4a-hydroxytetrahydrobiopterin dehydratase